jgi:hypothetical protein
MKTVNEHGDTNHPILAAKTFQEACLLNGLLNDVKEAMKCFEYAMITGTPPILTKSIRHSNYPRVSDNSNL